MSKEKRSNSLPDDMTTGRIGNRPLWVLYLSICLRAAHLFCASVFIAIYLLQDVVDGLFLSAAIVTGAILLTLESMRHRQIYRESVGIATAVKLLLLGFVVHQAGFGKPLLVAIFLLAAIISHAPRNIRHRLLF